jgi:hypothetical protein
MVEYLPSKHKALTSKPNTTKKKKSIILVFSIIIVFSILPYYGKWYWCCINGSELTLPFKSTYFSLKID